MRFNDDAFAVEQQCYRRIKCGTLLHCFPVVCVMEILMTCNTISFSNLAVCERSTDRQGCQQTLKTVLLFSLMMKDENSEDCCGM